MSTNIGKIADLTNNQSYRQHNSAPEVLLTADDTGQLANICLWDPKTGTQLAAYKGGVTAPNTLCFNVGKTFLFSAHPTKPLLNVWSIDRREQRSQKQTTPGKCLQCLTASPGSGKWIAGSVEDRIYLWQTQSGKLLAIIGEGGGQGHYQDVTHLSFTDDGSHIISAGKDGAIIAWCVVAAALSSGSCAPRRRWPGHSLAVTGLKVGPGGWRSGRIFTCSLDQMAKVHDLWSGDLLLEVTFGCGLTSIAVDLSVTNVYVGCHDGTIKTFSLLNPPRDMRLAINQQTSNTFSGHQKTVRHLSVSLDGSTLASGSDDNDVKLWHVASKQCSRTLSHKGIITATEFAMSPPSGCLDSTETDRFRTSLILAPFEKTLYVRGGKHKPDQLDESYSFQTFVRERVIPEEMDTKEDYELYETPKINKLESSLSPNVSSSNGTLLTENEKFKAINLELYQFAVNSILEDGNGEVKH